MKKSLIKGGFIVLMAVLSLTGLLMTGCPTPDSGSGKTLVSIEVTLPAELRYTPGNDLELSGIVVTATYSDGSKEVIDSSKLEISGYDKTKTGSQTITVSYGGKTATFTVGAGKTLESIEVTPPAKTRYNLGEDLVLDGMVVTATYDDGTKAAVTTYTTDTSRYDKTTVGHHTITVTYSGKTAEFSVNVVDPTLPTVEKPTASPAAGTYNTVQSVTLSTTTADAKIYYTTDGTEPTEESALYSGTISISVTTTIKAFAVKEGHNDSDGLIAAYTLQALTPTADTAEGTYDAVLSVTLSVTTENAEIRYTTDGTDPTASSPLYSVAISIGATTTLKAVAIKDGWHNSEILTVVYTLNFPFTSAPELSLDPGNAKITYTWTASVPAADSYDVYYKAGSGLTAENVKTGTRISNATSGGEITGLTNDTTYSVIVSAKKTDYSSIDSTVHTATPVALYYVITGSGSTFTATKNGAAFGTAGQPIQTVIDAIRTDVAGRVCIIQFGEEGATTALDIGGNTASFSGAWGKVELSGKITGNVNTTTTTTGTIVIGDDVSVTSTADIANTGGTNGRAVYHNSTGTLTISGGTVSGATGYAVNNVTTGAVSISGGTVSATSGRAVHNQAAGTVTISGGAVSATTGRAMHNESTGAITISGGAVSATSGRAVHNQAAGSITISGGTVSATLSNGNAVYNNAAGKITVSGTTTKLTSVNTSTSSPGTIYLMGTTGTEERLVITGGTVENTSENTDARAVYNNSTGAITISGGMVQITAGAGRAVHNQVAGSITISGGTVKAVTGRAVHNEAGGTVTISGGTVLAERQGKAAYNNGVGTITISGGTVQATEDMGQAAYNNGSGTLTVSGTALVTSVNANNTYYQGTIYNYSTGPLNITGGTVENTGGGYAIYNKAAGKITVSGTGKVTSANMTDTQGTIYLDAPSADNTNTRLEITGGTVENTGANGRAIYNASTGGITISGGRVQATGSGTVYSVYNANSSPGPLNMTIPPAVIVGNTYPPFFTAPPALTIMPDDGKITYTWTTSTPSAATYDVYWKIGNLSAAEVRASGTKVAGAASGGIITGLTNNTTYSVIVTANIATSSDVDSINSTALAAKPGIPLYAINGASGSFTATKGGITVGTANQPIQDVINAIRTDANGQARVIQFGNGSTQLDIGAATASFNNTSGTWGSVEISGKITSTAASSSGTIAIADAVSITSIADIANTATGFAINNTSTGTLTISGGTVSSTRSTIYHNSTGAVNISGGEVKTTGGDGYYAVNINSTGTVNISGGTVSAMEYQGSAVYNRTTGAVNISGGTVSGGNSSYTVQNASSGTISITGGIITTQNSGFGVYNRNIGTVSISGGTILSTTGSAVYNSSSGKITVSGTAKITSAATNSTDATIYQSSGAGQIEIIAGTVENTANSSSGVAISNSGAGTITISGGTVSSNGTTVDNNSGKLNISGGTVKATTYRAVYNILTGTVNISGGTVSATTGNAVRNNGNGKITVSGSAKLTSASATAAEGTIFLQNLNSSTTDEQLVITGGTIENTANSADARAIYNSSPGAITMSGGTVSITAPGGRAILNNSTGAVTISGGTVSATGASAYSIYNNSTGVVTVGPSAVITGARYP